jgi:hypothetical protein
VAGTKDEVERPPLARVGGGGRARAALVVAVALCGTLVWAATLDQPDEMRVALPTPSRQPATPAPAPERRILAQVVRDGEALSTIDLAYAAGRYHGFFPFPARWMQRPPQLHVLETGSSGADRLLLHAPLSLGDAARPGLPQRLASGELRLSPPTNGITRWSYLVQLEAGQPSGLTVAVELAPAFP